MHGYEGGKPQLGKPVGLLSSGSAPTRQPPALLVTAMQEPTLCLLESRPLPAGTSGLAERAAKDRRRSLCSAEISLRHLSPSVRARRLMMTPGPSSPEPFPASLWCSHLILPISNGASAARGLREALQLTIELINSLYYFTQINTLAVLSPRCDQNWFQPICECNKCPFIKSIHSAELLEPPGSGYVG